MTATRPLIVRSSREVRLPYNSSAILARAKNYERTLILVSVSAERHSGRIGARECQPTPSPLARRSTPFVRFAPISLSTFFRIGQHDPNLRGHYGSARRSKAFVPAGSRLIGLAAAVGPGNELL